VTKTKTKTPWPLVRKRRSVGIKPSDFKKKTNSKDFMYNMYSNIYFLSHLGSRIMK
jgi:hypothetical protein